MNPLLVLPAIIALSVGFVMLPVGLAVYAQYRRRKFLRCPETAAGAQIRVDARRAGLTAAVGRPLLRVTTCSLWPERQGCAQDCLDLPASAMRDLREHEVA
jgi:hypothetical protein